MSTIATEDGTQIYYNDSGKGPHGLCTTHKDQINEELLAFIKSGAQTARAKPERETA